MHLDLALAMFPCVAQAQAQTAPVSSHGARPTAKALVEPNGMSSPSLGVADLTLPEEPEASRSD